MAGGKNNSSVTVPAISYTNDIAVITLFSIALLISLFNLALVAHHHLKLLSRRRTIVSSILSSNSTSYSSKSTSRLPFLVCISFACWTIKQALILVYRGVLPIVHQATVSTRIKDAEYFIAKSFFESVATSLAGYVLVESLGCVYMLSSISARSSRFISLILHSFNLLLFGMALGGGVVLQLIAGEDAYSVAIGKVCIAVFFVVMDVAYCLVAGWIVSVLMKHQRNMARLKLASSFSSSSSCPPAAVKIKATRVVDDNLESNDVLTTCNGSVLVVVQPMPVAPPRSSSSTTSSSSSSQHNNNTLVSFLIRCLVISGCLSFAGAILFMIVSITGSPPLLFAVANVLGVLAYTNGGLFLIFIRVLFE